MYTINKSMITSQNEYDNFCRNLENTSNILEESKNKISEFIKNKEYQNIIDKTGDEILSCQDEISLLENRLNTPSPDTQESTTPTSSTSSSSRFSEQDSIKEKWNKLKEKKIILEIDNNEFEKLSTILGEQDTQSNVNEMIESCNKIKDICNKGITACRQLENKEIKENSAYIEMKAYTEEMQKRVPSLESFAQGEIAQSIDKFLPNTAHNISLPAKQIASTFEMFCEDLNREPQSNVSPVLTAPSNSGFLGEQHQRKARTPTPTQTPETPPTKTPSKKGSFRNRLPSFSKNSSSLPTKNPSPEISPPVTPPSPPSKNHPPVKASPPAKNPTPSTTPPPRPLRSPPSKEPQTTPPPTEPLNGSTVAEMRKKWEEMRE